MVNVSEKFKLRSDGGDFIRLEDVERAPIDCVLTRAKIVTTKFEDEALLCETDIGRPFICNRDRAKALWELSGSQESDNWANLPIRLYAGLAGDRPAIRICKPGESPNDLYVAAKPGDQAASRTLEMPSQDRPDQGTTEDEADQEDDIPF
jgi:hypothetical protein